MRGTWARIKGVGWRRWLLYGVGLWLALDYLEMRDRVDSASTNAIRALNLADRAKSQATDSASEVEDLTTKVDSLERDVDDLDQQVGSLRRRR